MAIATKGRVTKRRARATKARATRGKPKQTPKPKLVATSTATIFDRLVVSVASKRGTVHAHSRTDVKRVAYGGPHGITGTVPLGHRAVRCEANVSILQVSEDFEGGFDAKQFVARLLIEDFRERWPKRDEGEEWFAWVGSVSYHPAALTFWVGVSTNVPSKVLDLLEGVIKSMGFRTARTSANPEKHNLTPLLYLGDEGLELLQLI